MPMPNTHVLLAFLEDYFKLKKEEESGFTGMVKSAVWNYTEDRKTLIEKYKAKFNTAKTTGGWADIIVELGQDARAAQKQKLLSGDSKLALTLNAMRSYIIRCLRKDLILKKQYKDEISDRLILLNTGVKATRAGQDDTLSLRAKYLNDDGNGAPIEKSRTAKNNMLLALADLGHRESLREVLDLGLLTYEKVGDNIHPDFIGHVNNNHPLVYQKFFHAIFYVQYTAKFYPVPNELKDQWSIDHKKTDEYLRYSEFIQQVEKGPSQSNDKFATQFSPRTARGYNVEPTNTSQSSSLRQPSDPTFSSQPPQPSIENNPQRTRSAPPPPSPPAYEDEPRSLAPPKQPLTKAMQARQATFNLDGGTWSASPPAPPPSLEPLEEREQKDSTPPGSPSLLRRSGETDS